MSIFCVLNYTIHKTIRNRYSIIIIIIFYISYWNFGNNQSINWLLSERAMLNGRSTYYSYIAMYVCISKFLTSQNTICLLLSIVTFMLDTLVVECKHIQSLGCHPV